MVFWPPPPYFLPRAPKIHCLNDGDPIPSTCENKKKKKIQFFAQMKKKKKKVFFGNSPPSKGRKLASLWGNKPSKTPIKFSPLRRILSFSPPPSFPNTGVQKKNNSKKKILIPFPPWGSPSKNIWARKGPGFFLFFFFVLKLGIKAKIPWLGVSVWTSLGRSQKYTKITFVLN